MMACPMEAAMFQIFLNRDDDVGCIVLSIKQTLETITSDVFCAPGTFDRLDQIYERINYGWLALFVTRNHLMFFSKK